MFGWLRRAPKEPVSRLKSDFVRTALADARLALTAGDRARVDSALAPLLADAVVHPEACYLAALAARGAGEYGRAVSLLEAATSKDPALVEAWRALGEICLHLSDSERAVAAFRGLLARSPEDRPAQDGLLLALSAAGRRDEVRELRRMYRALDWIFDPLANPAAALHAQGRLVEAVDLLRKRLSLDSRNARLWRNLGKTRYAQGHVDTAIACFREAVRADPGDPEAQRGLASALVSAGEVEIALGHYRAASDLVPQDSQRYSDYLSVCAYRDWESPNAAWQAHAECERRMGSVASTTAPVRAARVERRLRIGYVSGDFGAVAMTTFLEPMLEHHDRERFEVVCYDRTPFGEHSGVRLQTRADRWVRARSLDWDALAQQVRDDRIDVLVDLTGHGENSPLPLFARRPAPLQVKWLGCPNTSGLRAVDAWFMDDTIMADLSGQYASEQPVSLGPFFTAFRPEDAGSEPAAPPVLERGVVTFGCLSGFPAVSPRMREAIAAILSLVPDSRCVFAAVPAGNAAQRLQGYFEEAGIANDRVRFQEQGSDSACLRSLVEVDVALDSLPCGSATAALHALWMGVPFVTRAGASYMTRVGASILSNVGLVDGIAVDDADYVARAAALAMNSGRLVALRRTLRDRLRESAIMDEAGFVRRFEAACERLFEAPR